MKRTDRLIHCADSQALEVFLGAFLVYQAWQHRAGGEPTPVGILGAAGVFGAAAALQGSLVARRWACAAVVCASVFLAMGDGAILVSLAATWAWYRTILDRKLAS